MMRKIKDTLRSFGFIASLKKITGFPENSLMISFFDILFFVSAYLFIRMMEAAVPLKLPALQNLIMGFWGPLIAMLYTLLYFGAIVLLYSFFKYMILFRIKNYFTAAKKDFRKVWQFFGMNMLFFITYFGLSLGIAYFVQASFKPEMVKPAATLLTGILLLLSYFYLNMTHSVFLDKGFSGALREAKKGMGKLKNYTPLLFMLGIFTAYSVIFYLIGLWLSGKSPGAAGAYNNIGKVTSFMVFYLVVYINRVHFYQLANKG